MNRVLANSIRLFPHTGDDRVKELQAIHRRPNDRQNIFLCDVHIGSIRCETLFFKLTQLPAAGTL